jgi:integrase
MPFVVRIGRRRSTSAWALESRRKGGGSALLFRFGRFQLLHRRFVLFVLRTRGDCDRLVFGRTATNAFVPSTVRSRALAAWAAENERRVNEADNRESVERLTPIGVHEARHTCASVMIAAGVNAKALSVIMGHATMP